MSNEYGIACLLEKSSAQLLLNTIPLIDTTNYPHISLFQFKCGDKTIINKMHNAIKKISTSKEFETTDISLIENNVFLNILDDSSLQLASDKIADIYSNTCSKIESLSQIDVSKLNQEELILTEKYGIYWIKQNYTPHITLAYNLHLVESEKIFIPKKICVNEIRLYKIDPIGRINLSL